jgi:hypothetical protein
MHRCLLPGFLRRASSCLRVIGGGWLLLLHQPAASHSLFYKPAGGCFRAVVAWSVEEGAHAAHHRARSATTTTTTKREIASQVLLVYLVVLRSKG